MTKTKTLLGILVGFTAFAFLIGPVMAMFPPGFDKAEMPDKAFWAVRDRNPNFKEAGFFAQDEIIIKFKGDKEPFRVLKVPEGKVGEKIKEFKKKADVIYAEPNYIAYALMTPNDPNYKYQWHLDNPVYGGIQMEKAWDVST